MANEPRKSLVSYTTTTKTKLLITPSVPMYVRIEYEIDVYDEGRNKPKTKTVREAVEHQVVLIRHFERRTYFKGVPDCHPRCIASHHWLVQNGWDLMDKEDVIDPMFISGFYGEDGLVGLSDYREGAKSEKVELKYGTAKPGIEELEVLVEAVKS